MAYISTVVVNAMGAQGITVPSGATLAVVFWSYWASTGGSNVSSVALTNAGTVSIRANLGVSGDSSAAGCATITSPTSGAQTLTVTPSATPADGPTVYIAFYDSFNLSDFFRDADAAAGDSTASVSTTIDSIATDTVIGLDNRYTDPPLTPPANETGWTSRATGTANEYESRLRTLDAPGASTSTINAQGTFYSSVVAISLKAPTGTTITPGVGTLTLTGHQPTVSVSGGTSITPGVGALVATGFAPGLGLGITPSTGTLSLAGAVPSMSLGITPAAGALVVAGHVPQLGRGITPAAGTLTVTGYEPTQTLTIPAPEPGVLLLVGHQPAVSVGLNVSTGVGALVVTGFAPSLGLGITPSTGTLSLVGAVPDLSTGITPVAGVLVLTGHQPAVAATANVFATPDPGALVLTGHQPTVAATANISITPDAGVLVVNGHAPSLDDSINITTQAGALAVAGHAPSLGLNIAPATGVLTLGGHAPVLSTGLTPGAGQIIVAGHVPTVEAAANIVVNPLTGALIITGYEPSVAATGQPQTGELVLTGHAPTVAVSGEDVATDPKLIARWPNVRVEGFGKRKKTPAPTAAPVQSTNMSGRPPVPRPLAGGLLAALADSPLPVAPTAKPTPAPTAASAPASTAAPAPRAAVAPPPPTPSKAPAAAAPAPAPVPAGITPEQMAALLQRMDALSEGMSSRLVEVNKALQGDIERVTQLLEAERDARLARELRERNEARAKEITARLLGSAP